MKDEKALEKKKITSESSVLESLKKTHCEIDQTCDLVLQFYLNHIILIMQEENDNHLDHTQIYLYRYI